MKAIQPWILTSILSCFAVLAGPTNSSSAPGDCGQPSSQGANPVASDVQSILRAAVGQVGTACAAKPCICDINGDGKITIVDAFLALYCLFRPWQHCPLHCNCPEEKPPCTSAIITATAGSDLDYGWRGAAHDAPVVGGAITVRVKRECSGPIPDVECRHDDDCAGNGVCLATCDCNNDTSCEVAGPTHERKCLNTLADCEANRCIVGGSTTGTVCETNADCTGGTCTGSPDCQPGIACVNTSGPPLPLASGGTPVCVVTYFDSPLTGTADSATGESLVGANLRSRIYLGNAGLEKPCPVCGSPEQEPKPGDVFTCDGGMFNNAACTVEGVSPVFGGTSSDCPPTSRQFNSTLAIRLREVTTDTTTRTAQLPCKHFGFTANPTVPGSNPKCLDKVAPSDPLCSSNADCTRCTEDTTLECSSNGDCTGNGVCAEAPDQPVTCGHWCNCGLCGGDPLLPCFGDEDCPGETTCEVGPGTGTQASAPQTRSNDCVSDKFICGGDGITERCETTLLGTCSAGRHYPCASDADCETESAGVCVVEPRPCFEPRITRSGEPSPLGRYCAVEDKTCETNADCTGEDDVCVDDASRPTTAALFCVGTSASASVNSSVGIMAPGAIVQKSLVEVCRCGDSELGCDEECDDGNTANGDGCDDLCQWE